MNGALQFFLAITVVLFLTLTCATVDAADFAGYWPFEEGKGDVTVDASGNENDGTILAAAGIEWVEGMVGGAILFDGNAYVDCGMGDSLMDAQTGSQSLTFWMRPSMDLEWTGGPEVLRGDLVYMRNGPMCAFRGNQKGQAVNAQQQGSVMFWAGGIPAVVSKTKKWKEEEWYHIAVSASKEDNKVALYVNGEEEASATGVSPQKAADMPFWIGGSQWWKFPGTMDEIKYWTRALTAAEVMKEFKAPTAVSVRDKLTTAWGTIKLP